MEGEFGLIKNLNCLLCKTSPDLISLISERTGLSTESVKSMMRYNIFTISQFAELTGLTISTIYNKIKPVLENGFYKTDLDFCFPFSTSVNEGPKFIVRNEKSEKFLKG